MLNSEQVKVCYSDVSAIQMLAIQIPTVNRYYEDPLNRTPAYSFLTLRTAVPFVVTGHLVKSPFLTVCLAQLKGHIYNINKQLKSYFKR